MEPKIAFSNLGVDALNFFRNMEQNENMNYQFRMIHVLKSEKIYSELLLNSDVLKLKTNFNSLVLFTKN